MKKTVKRWFHLCLSKRLARMQVEKAISEGKQQDLFCNSERIGSVISNADVLNYLNSKPALYYWPLDDCDNRNPETGACMGHAS